MMNNNYNAPLIQNQNLPNEQNEILEENLNQEQQLSPEEQRRQAQLKKNIDSLCGEMAYSISIVFVIGTFIVINKGTTCNHPISEWLAVVMGTYIIDFIFVMVQYHYLKKTHKENLIVMALRFIVLTFLTAWLIYGNVLYYDETKAQECSNGIKIIMFIVLLIGYFEMLKCCCSGLLVCIFLPLMIYHMRRRQRPNWIPAAPQFVQKLIKQKFDPNTNKAFEQCAICLLEFKENDEISPLPCDEKHYFHPDCIKGWLKNNNICPLCKKPITKEALEEQKKKLKSQKKK